MLSEAVMSAKKNHDKTLMFIRIRCVDCDTVFIARNIGTAKQRTRCKFCNDILKNGRMTDYLVGFVDITPQELHYKVEA